MSTKQKRSTQEMFEQFKYRETSRYHKSYDASASLRSHFGEGALFGTPFTEGFWRILFTK